MSINSELTRLQKAKSVLARAITDKMFQVKKCVRIELQHEYAPSGWHNGIQKESENIYKLPYQSSGFIGVSGTPRNSYGEADLTVLVQVLAAPEDAGTLRFVDTIEGGVYEIAGLTPSTDVLVTFTPARTEGYFEFSGFGDDGELELLLCAYESDSSECTNLICGYVDGTEKLDELAVALYLHNK